MTPESLKRGIVEIIDDYTTIRKMYEELKEHNSYLESRISESEDIIALRARVAGLPGVSV